MLKYFLPLLLTTSAYAKNLCSDMWINSIDTINFTKNELMFICPERNPKPWQSINIGQRKKFLENFLNSKGYYDINWDGTTINVGYISNIKNIILNNNVLNLNIKRFWSIYNTPITPQAIDRLKKWIVNEYAYNGMPCIDLEVKAYPTTGMIIIDIKNATIRYFPVVDVDTTSGLNLGIEQRFFSFEENDKYNLQLLELSKSRLEQSQVVLSANFYTQCLDNTDLKISLGLITGKSRLISVGFGVDSEDIFIVEGLWRSSRLGRKASLLEGKVYTSYYVQEAGLKFDWYYSPIVINHFLRSTITLTRQKDARYGILSGVVKTGPAWLLDAYGRRNDLWINLLYNYAHILQGDGQPTSHSLEGEIVFQSQSHDFEYYKGDAHRGNELQLLYSISSPIFYGTYSKNHMRFLFTQLWNLFNYSPPIWILGLRVDMASLGIHKESYDGYPEVKRLRLGGSKTIRGFSKNSIPTAGAKTTAYAGIELRLVNLLPYNIQPILFYDMAQYGDNNYSLTSQVYQAPGFGVHLPSFIGLFRLSAALGTEATRRGWQIYFSYGENF